MANIDCCKVKLTSKFFGPYPIIKIDLQLPAESRINSVFHVSQLKKKLGPKVFPAKDQPLSTPDGPLVAESLAILDLRVVKMGNHA